MAFLMVWANAVSHVPGLVGSTELSAISPVFGEVSAMWSAVSFKVVVASADFRKRSYWPSLD
jgi:hypothetical protein